MCSVAHIIKLTNDYGSAITAVATVLLTVVTAGLVWMARRQFTTTHAQLRAYVFVDSAQVVTGPGSALRSQISFKNFGQTPAYKFKIVGTMGMEKTFEMLPTATGDPTGSTAVLAPSGSFQWYMDLPAFPAAAYQQLTNGEATLFVHGEITYEDAFGKSRHLKYRMMWGGPLVGTSSNHLCACSEGNESN